MDFKKAINEQDVVFDSILEIMKAGRGNTEEIESARKFLMVVNLVIDYYTKRDDQELKIPVVYFPICNNNSQELCEDFVALKLGFFTDKEYTNELCGILERNNHVRIYTHMTPEKIELARKEYDFEKNHLLNILHTSTIPDKHVGKSLLYSENLKDRYDQYRIARNRNRRNSAGWFWYLSKAINGDYVRNADSPLSLINGDSECFYDTIINREDNNLKNFVFFPCRSADGIYSNFCLDTIQKAYLDDFISAGNGLRNVFLFRFSRKPFRLRRQYDIKELTMRQISDNSIDFITFNYEEATVLFNQKEPAIKRIAIKSEKEIELLSEPLFDQIISCLDGNYILRCNESTLCITPELKDYYTKKLSSESETDDTILSQILKLSQELWDRNTDTYLTHFLDEQDVCIVLANEVDNYIKEQLSNWIQKRYSVVVHFASFGDLRGYLDNDIYKNRISSKRILILSFRNDYTESIFHKYPNSFDPICINNDQKVLIIENHFIMGQYFDKGWNKYCKATNRLFKSEFRSNNLKPILMRTRKTTRDIFEDTYDEMNDRNTRAIKQTKVVFSDGTQRLFPRSEWMLYCSKENGFSILPLSDLADIYSSSYDELSIQPMSTLVNLVYENYIEHEREKDKENERIFKENTIYGLSPIEINNELPLWKILLKKKFEELSPKGVYEQIMTTDLKVDYSVFLKWPNKDYGLPKYNRLQERLIRDYLKIKDPYLKLERRIKERNRDNTESINSNIRLFLSQALVSNNYSVILHKTNEETQELLGIEDANDIKRIVTFVKQKINLEPIKTITL